MQIVAIAKRRAGGLQLKTCIDVGQTWAGLDPAAAGERLLTDQAGALTATGIPSEVTVGEEQFEELIDIDRVEGRVKASSVNKVGGLVEKHPEEALSILRSWMYQEG